MKKKFLSLISIALCSILLSSCSEAVSESSEEFSGIELAPCGLSNLPIYTNLEQLENESDVIVVGTFKEDAKQEEVYTYEEAFEKDILLFVKSQNNIEISKVIKGDLQVENEITILQAYGVVDNQLITYSKLTPMLKGDTWIFFLKKNEDETYTCIGDCGGRYPIKNTKYKKIALTDNEDLGVYDKSDFNEEVYNEILEKYEFE